MKLRLISKRRTRASRPKNHGAIPRDWLASVPSRPRRPRKLIAGRMVMVRNAASATNGKGRALIVRHAGDSTGLRLGRFDLRSRMGKEFTLRTAALVHHLGGAAAVSVPQRILVDRAVRLGLLVETAWDELSRMGVFRRRGELRAAFAAFRSAVMDERATLTLLGLESRARDLPRLKDLLSEDRS